MLVAAVALIAFTFLVVLQPVVWGSRRVRSCLTCGAQSSFTRSGWARSRSRCSSRSCFGHNTCRRAGAVSERSCRASCDRDTVARLRRGFGFYLSRFSQITSPPIRASSVMIALVFLYTLAAIFVFGGEGQQRFCAPASPRGRDGKKKKPARVRGAGFFLKGIRSTPTYAPRSRPRSSAGRV